MKLETLKDQFTLDDVGSTLLEQLAQGLYQPYEVIREYIQNSVDAHRIWTAETGTDPEGPIQIEVRGDVISILDYGIGMDEAEIRKVKSIAVSKKRDADIELTGYKGVGIWAGLSFFKTLRLYTTRRGSSHAYELVIYFSKIVESINAAVSIGEALNPHYYIDIYEADPTEHYTNVSLEQPVRSSELFLDPARVIDAVRNICPCEIDPNFGYHDKVTDWYRDNGFEFFRVEVNGKHVYRSYSGAIEKWDTGLITVNDKAVAKYWKAIHKTSGVISPSDSQLVGIRLVQHGFALGDPNPYSDKRGPGLTDLNVGNYPDWYVGEIHLVSPELRPDLERRELEESEASSQFVSRLRDWYKMIEQDARTLSEERRKRKEYEKLDKSVRVIEESGAPLMLAEAERQDLEKLWTDLVNEDNTVQKHRGKRNVSPKIRGLRAVTSERKKLLARINAVLPQPLTISPQHDEADDQQQDSTTYDIEPDFNKNEVETSLPESSIVFERSEVDTHSIRLISIDVVHGLLEEVLEEELPDDPSKRVNIVVRLEKRLNMVIDNE
jgi:hypothetical protein